MTALLAPRSDIQGAQYTTYRIGGPLKEAYLPETKADVVALCRHWSAHSIRPTIIGWGSNLILASSGIAGPVLITRKMSWIHQNIPTTFTMGAGVFMIKAAKTFGENGLTGGEFLIGVPGTMGGGVRMNAGANGQEMTEIVQSATLFNWDSGELETWSHQDCQFQYRHSAINPEKHLVIEVTLSLTPGDESAIQDQMTYNQTFRKTHQPVEPNAGSVFKNPFPKDSDKAYMSVGWMLDQLGAKGRWREGDVQVSARHGNFIVNLGHGTSTDVLRLMVRMKRAIWDNYGAVVMPENFLVGDITEEEAQLWSVITATTLD